MAGTRAKPKFVVLGKRAFQREYTTAFRKLDLKTERAQKRFRDEVFTVQSALERALKRRWEKEVDFEVGWDFNYCYHTCGGIYSRSIWSPDYVRTVIRTLDRVDPKGLWTYHTACEILDETESRLEFIGQIFFRGSACYIEGSSISRERRAGLGCSD